MSFANALYRLRTARGLSQMELSKALDGKIAQSTIGLYESGRRFPRKEYVEMLAEFFNVPVSTFYMEDVAPDDELASYIINRMHTDAEYRTLFEVTRHVRSDDLAPVNAILKSIAREREANE